MMFFAGNIIIDLVGFCIGLTLILLVPFSINPRLFWNDMPESIKTRTDPPTAKEKVIQWLLFVVMIGFAIGYLIASANGYRAKTAGQTGFWGLFWHIFWQIFSFNLIDLLILDWLLFATINPKWMSMPGTQGDPAYREYKSHFIGFLIGTGLSLLMASAFALIYSLL